MKKQYLILIIAILLSISSASAWLNTSYNFCVPITNATISNYSFPIYLNATTINYSKTTGEDFLIGNGSCQNSTGSLNHWVEYWNESGTSLLWIRTPLNATGNYSIYFNGTSLPKKDNINDTFLYGDEFTGNRSWRSVSGSAILFNGSLVLGAGDGHINKTIYFPEQYLQKTRVKANSAAGSSFRYSGGTLGEDDYGATEGIMMGENAGYWAYYSGGWKGNGTAITINQYTTQEARSNSTSGLYDYYADGTLIATKQSSIGVTAPRAFIFDNNAAGNIYSIDWLIITENNISAPIPTKGTEEEPYIAPIDLKFYSQDPGNITIASFFSQLINITYNYTNTNLTTPINLNFTTYHNSTCYLLINGTCTKLNDTATLINQTSNYTSTNYTLVSYTLGENDLLPRLSNLNFTHLTTSNTYNLLNQNSYISTSLLNMTSLEFYNILEMSGLSTNNLSKVYACNSTFTHTTNPSTSTNCLEIGNMKNAYNHSTDQLIPFTVINNKINDVLPITYEMYIIQRGANSGTHTAGYTTNYTRAGATRTTTNSFTTYTNTTNTGLIHIHSVNGIETVKYFAIGNYSGTATSSNTTTELIDLIALNPSAPVITNPIDNNQSTRYLNITYNNATSNVIGGTISSYNISLLNSDTSFNRTIQGNNSLNNSYYWNVYNENLTIGTWYIDVRTIDSTGLSSSDIEMFNLTRNAEINITTYNIAGTKINNFTGNITNIATGQTETFTSNNLTTNGSSLINVIKNTTYNFFIDATGYAYLYENYTTNESLNYQDKNFTLYTTNSVTMNIYDEDTGTLILQNITVVVQGGSTTTYTTTTGHLYVDNLTDGSYTIFFSNANYTLKSYAITVSNRSTQTLNAYLTTSVQYVIFNTLDFDSSSTLVNATYTQSRNINGTWTIIDTRYADITGRTQFSYAANVNYQFTVSLNGYTTEQFNLNPIIFTSYTIRLHKITTLNPNNIPQGLGVVITYEPTSFYNNGSIQNFTWQISDATGSLVFYNLTITTPGFSINQTGVNAQGEIFILPVNTSLSSNMSDTVDIKYCYDTTLSSPKCFKYSYFIIGTYAPTSFKGNKDNTYGLKTFERVFIFTLFELMIAGIAFFIGGMLIGLPIALLLLGYFYYIGFISLWMVIPTVLLGMIILFGRQE